VVTISQLQVNADPWFYLFALMEFVEKPASGCKQRSAPCPAASTIAEGVLVKMNLTRGGEVFGRIINVFRRKINAPRVIAFIVSEPTRNVFVFVVVIFHPGSGWIFTSKI